MKFDPSKAAPLIDGHAHILLQDLPRSAGTSTHMISEDFGAERYVETLTDHGVQYGIMVASSQVGLYNDYQIHTLRKYKRLRATVIVRPDVDFYVLENMNTDGVIGIRLAFRTIKELPDLTSPDWRRLLRRARDLDWHVHMHIESARFPQVWPALAASGVKLVIDHFGRPEPDHGVNCPGFQAMLQAFDSGRLWVKLSAPYRLDGGDAKAYAHALLKSGGPERLLWASDWPFTSFEYDVTYAQTVQWLEDWIPDPAVRYKIHTETPRALFNLDK